MSVNTTITNGAALVPPAIAVTSDTVAHMALHTWHAYRYGAHFRYLPLVVLPPLPHEQFVHVQLLPHLQPESPWPPTEHNKQDTQL